MTLTPEKHLAEALMERHVLVVCGAGGVGKTTTAASIALRAALMGRRVLVCTIDPSRRLAISLGLKELSEKPRALSLSRLGGQGSGALWAMTLDTKRTFDSLIERHAPTEASRRLILENRFYGQVSSALAGSHEYMAMEKLLELSTDSRFDLVVLDTPPTPHALDFLDAPDRLLSFLDTSVLRWFLRPYFVAGRLTLTIATRTGALALRLADRVLGLQFLQDLSEFFLAFDGMYDGFKERAQKVQTLLRDLRSGFILISSPARLALEEALYFHSRLREKEMPFLTLIVNRVHFDPAKQGLLKKMFREEDAFEKRLNREEEALPISATLVEPLIAVYKDQQLLARTDRRHLGRLQDEIKETMILIPEFEADIHDLRGLRDMGDMIFSSTPPPRSIERRLTRRQTTSSSERTRS